MATRPPSSASQNTVLEPINRDEQILSKDAFVVLSRRGPRLARHENEKRTAMH